MSPKVALDMVTVPTDTISSVLGRWSGGDTTLGGAIPDMKAFKANATNIPMFSLISRYAGNLNYGLYFLIKINYKLPSLAEVEAHIQANHRLPDIPSEKEISDKGLDVAEMQKLQMQKIEELTLYLIEEHKANQKLQQEVEELKKKLETK